MKIVFNKVTWYSKLAAIFVFFVIVPLVSFYLGSYYEQTKILIQNISEQKNSIKVPLNESPISTSTVSHKPIKSLGNVVCTMEAKQCPDGSYVGRVGPNCEFTPCP